VQHKKAPVKALFALIRLVCGVGQQCYGTGAFDGLGQLALMLCARSAHAAGRYLAPFGDIPTKTANVFEIDISYLACAEIAYFFARTPSAGSAPSPVIAIV
jgi:hypothetical protein